MYKIEEVQKTVYTAQTRGKTDIIDYEFYQSDKGWWVTRQHSSAEAPFPMKEQMYLPNDVVEKILLVQSAKTALQI